MKLKAIAATFKRGKFLRIYTMPNGEQWIGNGAALYKMSGMPELTPAVVLKIFDIPEDKQSEWNCELADMPEHLRELCDYDLYKPEPLLEQMKVSVEWYGVTQIFFRSQSAILAVDEKLAKPLYDDVDYLRFALRPFGKGIGSGIAVVCYNAMLTPKQVRFWMAIRTNCKKRWRGARTVEKTDKEKKQILDEIAERANKEMNALTDTVGEALAGSIYDIMAQIKYLADKIGVSRDVLLLVFSNSILQKLISESEPGNVEKKPKPAIMLYEPPKSGYTQ